VSALGSWDKGFDENLKPLVVVPVNRGKAAKVTVEVVRCIVEKAKEDKARGKRIRLKQFAADLKSIAGIDLGAKTVEQILIANDIYKARTRKNWPRFYQSLCRKIPNGLVSLDGSDGSDVIVWLGDVPCRFNVELAVDVVTFAQTAFGIAETETAEQVIEVLDSHRTSWGLPIGVLYDHGSANISGQVQRYLNDLGIEPVPAGPGSPKGNGADEGAFSQMKKALGTIRLDISSSKALARSVLDALVFVYVYMRNRLPVGGTAFLKATSRKADRRNLPYFFGILKNIQPQRDDEAKAQYYRERYNYQVMLNLDRQKNAQPPAPSIKNIIEMLGKPLP
jgi:transposase InsO family protein